MTIYPCGSGQGCIILAVAGAQLLGHTCGTAISGYGVGPQSLGHTCGTAISGYGVGPQSLGHTCGTAIHYSGYGMVPHLARTGDITPTKNSSSPVHAHSSHPCVLCCTAAVAALHRHPAAEAAHPGPDAPAARRQRAWRQQRPQGRQAAASTRPQPDAHADRAQHER
eukprot:361562-Chlamydomonas_euryale.AAC.1